MEFFDDIITYEGFKNDIGNGNEQYNFEMEEDPVDKFLNSDAFLDKHFKMEANVFKNENSEIHTHEDVSNF